MNIYSKCPIELVVRLIKKKWVVQILRDLFFGKSRFSEFKKDKPLLSNKVLSNCLKSMEKDGLIQRISDRYERDVEYILTKKGQALNKIVYELAMFSIDEDMGDTKFNDETKGKLRSSFKDKLLFKS
ncbi:MAG: helix-turn-helix transcriptional regulator [Methanobrevibacter millerae]|uniref:Helix-turn-helix transcriptional regulator n=1 Tax=Methanobrevibacter millerae TaxID=230361 RepID=A0A8T3VI05_9EURY|nr:helix-turn-helix transcriptional regulator [Methanobrevibacter millerae]